LLNAEDRKRRGTSQNVFTDVSVATTDLIKYWKEGSRDWYTKVVRKLLNQRRKHHNQRGPGFFVCLTIRISLWTGLALQKYAYHLSQG
jgi:hypothetical protein